MEKITEIDKWFLNDSCLLVDKNINKKIKKRGTKTFSYIEKDLYWKKIYGENLQS